MCILLTGYTDKQNASHALNEADIYQYMEKPWDNDHLLLVLRNGFQEKDLRQQLREKIRVLGRRITEHSELSEAFRPRICAPHQVCQSEPFVFQRRFFRRDHDRVRFKIAHQLLRAKKRVNGTSASP